MEPPSSLAPKSIRDEKVKVLQALRPFTDCADLPHHICRAQYDGYRQEAGVNPASETETYIACRTYIDNWRWGGVPFLIRTGKHLPKRFTSVAVQFRMPPHTLFGSYQECYLRPNKLTLRIQPDDGIDMDFDVKEPGQGINIRPEAYERLLLDVIVGDQSLFIRSDEVEASWRWADSLRTAMKDVPILTHPQNTWGPKEAGELFGECEGRWVTG